MKHRFVEFIPDVLNNGEVYISIPYNTVVHNCACGCGCETVTPLSPRDWSLTYDGDAITLYPSIGNWSLPCRSHYWIRNGQIIWAPSWSDAEIAARRGREALELDAYYYDQCYESLPPGSLQGKSSLIGRVMRAIGDWFR